MKEMENFPNLETFQNPRETVAEAGKSSPLTVREIFSKKAVSRKSPKRERKKVIPIDSYLAKFLN